jgi:dTDP-glucose 4,6-dehydratase
MEQRSEIGDDGLIMKNILVTGGAGFIGSNFIRYWRDRHPGDRLIVLDALTYAGNRSNLDGIEADERYRFVEGNICDRELVSAIFTTDEPDVVVHFAAESHVDRSIRGPEVFAKTKEPIVISDRTHVRHHTAL